MSLPRPASPRALWADLRTFSQQRGRHRAVAAFFAILMPIVIVFVFYLDGKTNILPDEQIIYAESWPANRSDAEIKAQQKIDMEREEAAAAARQRQFQKLEKRFGM